MSTPVTVTPEQQATLKLVADFQKALLPAKLAPTQENGAVLAIEMNKRGLPHTVESVVRVVNEILFENKLTWAIPPAKLAARKANNAIQNQGDAKRGQDAFAAKVKAGEAADAQKVADEASIKQAKSLIAGYNPTRNNRYDERERIDSTALWTHNLNEAIAGKQNLQKWVEALSAVIQKRYADREKASERI
jgi:hypothetical protein